jgi:DNA uptake protein ComE-like DNA-binding protein
MVKPSTLSTCLIAALLASGGCGYTGADQGERDAKTRDEVAKATERAKPAIQEAGREVGRAAESAVEEAHAAAQGIRDGWNNNNARHPVVDLNSADERELVELPGVTKLEARRIIAGRPYHDKHDVVSRGIISDDAYQRIRDQITTR